MGKQRLIDIALAEVGYLEKKSNTDLDDKTANAGSKNFTKYARDLAMYPYFNGSKSGVAWCSVFVAWCFVQAFGKDEAVRLLCQPSNPKSNCGAGCGYARRYFKGKKRLFDSPAAGDVVFFWSKDKSSISHTGIIYQVDDVYVYTVEGNTSGESGVIANGGGVHKKRYSKTYSRLAGFGRPDYRGTSVPATSQNPTGMLTLRQGDRGDSVRNLQQKLSALGYDLGATGVDGIFGDRTNAAAKAFQADAGIMADGIVGAKTWAALYAAQPEVHIEYTVCIPGLTASDATALVETWPGAYVLAEKVGDIDG